MTPCEAHQAVTAASSCGSTMPLQDVRARRPLPTADARREPGQQRAQIEPLTGAEAEPAVGAGGRQLAGSAGRDEAAVVDDDDGIGEPLGLVHRVSGQHDRHPAAAQVTDQLPGVAAALHVEPGRRLIEKDQFRTPDHGHAQREPLLLTARQAPVGGPGDMGEAEAFEQLARVERVGGMGGQQVEHLQRAGARVAAARLQHHADSRTQRPRVADRIQAEHPHLPRVRAAKALADLDGRRLARAVGPQQRRDLACSDRRTTARPPRSTGRRTSPTPRPQPPVTPRPESRKN